MQVCPDALEWADLSQERKLHQLVSCQSPLQLSLPSEVASTPQFLTFVLQKQEGS